MSQDFRDLLGTDTLGASRTYLNDSNEALQTCFMGSSEPDASIRRGGMFWGDTGAVPYPLLKQRTIANDGWVEIGRLDTVQWGLLSKVKLGQTMSVGFSMGYNAIEDLGVGGAYSAARRVDLTDYAPITSPDFAGDPTVGQDPAGSNSIPRRSWCEATFLAKSGGTATGRVGTSAGGTPASTDFLKKSEVAAFTGFNTTTGHRHDGSDGRKVRAGDLSGVDITGYSDCSSSGPTEIIKGSYTADNTNDRTISLPFRPSVVVITQYAASDDFRVAVAFDTADALGLSQKGGETGLAMALQDRTTVPEISANGFIVSQLGSNQDGLNDTGRTYAFIAWR